MNLISVGRRYIPQETIRVAPSQLFEKVEVKTDPPPAGTCVIPRVCLLIESEVKEPQRKVKQIESTPVEPPKEKPEHTSPEKLQPAGISHEKPATVEPPVVEKPKEQVTEEKKGLTKSGEQTVPAKGLPQEPHSPLRSESVGGKIPPVRSIDSFERPKPPPPVTAEPKSPTIPPVPEAAPVAPQPVAEKPEIVPLGNNCYMQHAINTYRNPSKHCRKEIKERPESKYLKSSWILRVRRFVESFGKEANIRHRDQTERFRREFHSCQDKVFP